MSPEPTLEQIAENRYPRGVTPEWNHAIFARELLGLRERLVDVENWSVDAEPRLQSTERAQATPDDYVELDHGVTREMLHHDLRRAERERDEARVGLHDWNTHYVKACKERDAAVAHADTLIDQRDEARSERDESVKAWRLVIDEDRKQRDAARADATKLRKALATIVDTYGSIAHLRAVARKALGGDS